MNERIFELAGEAGLKVESRMTNPPKPFQILGSMEEFEKFAELIVGECAEIADNADATREKWQSIGKFVKEHFGVEL